MPKIVAAFVRAEVRQALAEERPERRAAATACGANEGLELREAELDGIEVRAIGWQVPEGGPGSLEGALDAGDLVGPEVVGDDDVAGLQGRHQDLFDVEAGAVFVDPRRPPCDPRAHGLARLGRGLDENIRLVVAKSAIELETGGVRFGAKEHEQDWLSGLTILSAIANVLDDLAPDDRARALTQALAWIAAECEGQPPRRPHARLRREVRRARRASG